MYSNQTSNKRHYRLPHAIATAALGTTIALAGIPVMQAVMPVGDDGVAYAQSATSGAIDDPTLPIKTTIAGNSYYFGNMQDAVDYAVKCQAEANIVLQEDYTGPAPIIDVPDTSSLHQLRFDLNKHTWTVTGEDGLVVPSKIDHFFVSHGTLRTDSAKVLVTSNKCNSTCLTSLENTVENGTAVKATGIGSLSFADESDIKAPHGTAIETHGVNVFISGMLKGTVEGDIAYGDYNGNGAVINVDILAGYSKTFLTDFRPLDGADKCAFMINGGTWKDKLPEAWLQNESYWFSWSDNADGTHTLNRLYWEEGDGIPAEDMAVYNAWNKVYWSTDASSPHYKPFPGVNAAKAHLAQLEGGTGGSDSGSSSSGGSGSSGSSSSSSSGGSGSSSTVTPSKEDVYAAQAKAFKKAKAATPKVKMAKGHKAGLTWKAIKAPKGMKALSYQISYKQKGKVRTITVKASDAKSLKYTVKKLTKGKKYSFKMRAVTKINGKVCYSAWSVPTKAIKAK